MKFSIPDLCFLTSSVPLKFDTDGYTTSFHPSTGHYFDPGKILVLTNIHVQIFGLRSINGVFLFDTLVITDDFRIPEVYDGTQNLGGKRILILMLNGWGDMILIKPALRAFYEKTISSGDPPTITLGCNWISNFPYPGVPYIQDIRPNILTLKELSVFDLLINLIPVNHQRSLTKSMKDLCLEIMKLSPEHKEIDLHFIVPDPERVAKIQPIFDQIRKETGKKLLCINWKSRFPHKNASPVFFLR